MEYGACGVQVRRTPAFGPTLRANYGSGLSVFLATYPMVGVLAKRAKYRIRCQRAGSDFVPTDGGSH